MVPPFDILTEHSRCQGLTQRHLDHFRAMGVPRGALIKSAMGAWSMLARDRVIFSGTRFEFERHAHGGNAVGAVVIPAFSEFGDLVDMIAWRPPATVATWLGRAGMLGEELVNAARFGEPLMVHESPLGWLKAGRQSVCVVDPARAAPLLRQAGPLAVDDVAHGMRLRQALTIAPPEILIRQVAAEVAA